MKITTLAIRDEDLDEAARALAALIRRETHTHGGYLCLPMGEEEALVRKLLAWIAQRRLTVAVDASIGGMTDPVNSG